MNTKVKQVLRVGSLVAITVGTYLAGYGIGYYTTPHVKDSIGMAYNSAPTEAAKEALRREAGVLFGAILAISSGSVFFVITRPRLSRSIALEGHSKLLNVVFTNEPPAVKGQPETVTPVSSDDNTASIEQQRPAGLGLLVEIENNLRTANNPHMDELSPFLTGVWDANPRAAHIFPSSIQEHLIQAYADMRLANNIVWLATEFSRRSGALDKGYVVLCARIATALSKVMSADYELQPSPR